MVYAPDTLQCVFRRFMEDIMIRTFASLVYKVDQQTGIYKPSFSKPPGFELIDAEVMINRVLNTYTFRGCNQPLKNLVEQITPRYLARVCIDLTSTFIAGKNWNSRASKLGATICEIAAMIHAAPVQQRFRRIQGVPLGGQRHGSRDTKYVEYMTSTHHCKGPAMEKKVYLDQETFFSERHYVKVNEIMEKMHFYAPQIPKPRPVRGHTVDFACQYLESTVVDGECKLNAPGNGHEAAVLVLHSLNQLAYCPKALAILTTNTTVYVYKSTLDQATDSVNTIFCQVGDPYTLQHPLDPSRDDRAKNENIMFSPGYRADHGDGTNEECKVTIPLGPESVDVYNGKELYKMWTSMRSEPRRLLSALVSTIDVLVYQLSSTDFTTVHSNIERCYTNGLTEFSYNVSDSQDNRKHLSAQDDYVYSIRTMQPQIAAHNEERMEWEMYRNYQDTLERERDHISQEFTNMLLQGMANHKEKHDSYQRKLDQEDE